MADRDRLPWSIRSARLLVVAQTAFTGVLGTLCLVGGRDYRPVNVGDPNIGPGLTVFGAIFVSLAVALTVLNWQLARGAWWACACLVIIELMWLALALVGFTGLGLLASGSAAAVMVFLLVPGRSRAVFARAL